MHARTMSICVMDGDGDTIPQRDFKASSAALLKVIAPYGDDLAIAVEGMFTWYELADLCAREGIPLVLGHVLTMKAIHGGKATHDTIDAHTIAALLRGGMLPQVHVDPADIRVARD